MTFLNPFVLFGLAAAAIPVLLHLLNLRRLRTVDFSSVRFLKELQKTSMRRLRIRQMLLLVIRTLLILAIVLAFSRPTLHLRLGGLGAAGTSSTMIIIVDDSPSMTLRDERGAAFTRAVQAASGLIDIATDRDRLYIVPLSALRPGTHLPPPRSRQSAHEALQQMAPSVQSVPLEDALRSLRPILATSRDANREVLFVSDGQATQILRRGTSSDTGAALESGATLFLCSSPALRHGNTGITAGELLTRIVSEGKPLQFRPRISNAGEEPVRESVVSLFADGSRVAQQTVSIAPRGEVSPLLTFTVKRRGILGCSVRLEDDAFEADNTYAFVLDVPEHTAVLLTGPDSPSTGLATLALTLGGDSLLAGHLSARQITNVQLPATDISRFDVIIVCGFESLDLGAARSLSRFARDGGGLILFPHGEPGPGGSALFRDLGIPRPAGPPLSLPEGSFISFSTIDYAHPLFEGLFDTHKGSGKGKPGVESPIIRTSVPLSAGEKGSRVISLTDGNAFLVDYSTGGGHVLAFSVEAGTGWSDFPHKGLFAPLLHRAVAYAGNRATQHPPIEAGEPLQFSLRLRDFTDRDTYTVTSPDGHTQKVLPEFQPGGGTARFDGGTATEQGVYRLSRDGRSAEEPVRDIAALAVNISPAETDLRSATEGDIEVFRAHAGIVPAQIHTTGPERAVETVQQTRYGVELWKDFLILAIALAIAEMAIGRTSKGASRGGEGARP